MPQAAALPAHPAARRIAVVANTAWYLANFRLNLMQALRAAGHDVVAVAPAGEHAAQLTQAGLPFEPVAISGAASEITVAMLPQELRDPAESMVATPVAIPDEGINFVSVVSQLERELILRCLEKTGGNKRQAAKLLQLSRTTLIDKLQRLKVHGDFAA